MARNALQFAEHLYLRSALLEPRVVPIYWDPYFRKVPMDAAVFDEFLRTLFHSSWMSELASYGFTSPRLLRSFIPKDEAPATLTRTALEAKLVHWLTNGSVAPKPKRAERSLVYLLLTPSSTKLTPREAKKTHASYQASACFERDSIVRDAASQDHNLFYSVVPFTAARGDILEQNSRPISQALTTAFVRGVRKH